MNAERTFKRLAVFAGLFFTGIIALGLANEPQGGSAVPARPAPSYSHEVLQQDALMTQQMSTPNAPVHRNDAQLGRSQDPGYVRAFEQHQEDIDRMLAQ
ncbi:hypothetical protein [Actinomarinicola tropica]|uniref:Uncharacterized protein n=1 Tax=Actinomarinicola tropica TaxID=2789776 RepID=A0A5Q2RMV0_9ACTN|nr:hypothetical protein [Actinomarinicola tropica]QGG96262.1 hypothetical protein GH723_14775 [Actinomarinicola tropica]